MPSPPLPLLRAALSVAVSAAAAAAAPACASREPVPGRFPVWPATWDLQSSTIIQPCNMSGFLEPAEFWSKFGVVDVDWSNAKSLWVVPPMSAEELLVEQAARLKAARPGVKVWVYRNIVKALPWFTGVRALMDEPANAGLFLPFSTTNTSYHVPQCDKNYDPPRCSTLYHDQEQTPEL